MSQSKLYIQQYRKEWESNPEFKGWLKPFIGDDTRAYCLYCKADFYTKLSDVKKHMTTQKHTQKAKPYNSSTQNKLPFMVQKIDSAKKVEATMALAIAEHCSMLACDLGERNNVVGETKMILTQKRLVTTALDRRVRQRVPANIQQLRTAIEEEWDNIPQATINSLINFMQKRYVGLHEPKGKVELRTSTEVKAQCDQNVTLQCDIMSSSPLKIILFSWVRKSKQPCLVNATGVFSSPGVLCDNTNNSLTLTLTRVTPFSEGNYTCKLRSNLAITAANTTVTMQECLRTSVHKVFQNESQVECQYFGVYPEGTVHWFLGSENITESASTESQQDKEGLFDIRSTLPTQAGTEPYNCSLWMPSSGTYSSHKQLHYSRGISSGTRTRSRLLLVFILVGLIIIT